MKKPEAKKDLKKAIAAYIEDHSEEIVRAILEERDLREFFGWKAYLYDAGHVLIEDYYEDLQDYEDDVKEVYEEVAKDTKAYFLFAGEEIIDVYLDKGSLEYYANECARDFAGEGETVGTVETTLWECNPGLRPLDLLERFEAWGRKNYVKELFQASAKSGRIAVNVLLNFRPSKMAKPVNDYTDGEWKAEIEKFAAFHEAVTSGKAEGLGLDDPKRWTDLHQDLARRMLEELEESRR